MREFHFKSYGRRSEPGDVGSESSAELDKERAAGPSAVDVGEPTFPVSPGHFEEFIRGV